jgi:flagellar hook protein FlgE
VQSTGKNTDLCLSGNGLFVVNKGDQTFYTRNGAFEFDAEGNYVLPGSGLFVQGWMGSTVAAGAGGGASTSDWSINTNAATTNITIQAGKSMPAKQTTKSIYTGNINADEAVNTKVTTTITAYDSDGFKYSIPIIFTKVSDTPNAGSVWQATVMSTNANFTGSGTQTINFDVNGRVTAPTTLTATIGINAPSNSGAASTFKIDVNLSNITTFANESTLHAESNGNAAGTLESISIDSSGIITGVYTNGERRAEAQVAVAQFTNASGLTKTGNSLYQESNNSGSANVKTASALGVTITPSALEMSNVDVANEFADMIITQRGFQSNSKIVTVGDEMLETVINMKR